MILSRTPLRIPIAGGGTDLPSFYSRCGGFFISAAINRYVYLALHRTFERSFIIKYSRTERASSVAEILHPIVREAFSLHGVEPYLELVSLADIPAGTGLGSSGAFTVGLIHALRGMKALGPDGLAPDALAPGAFAPAELAREASRIEIDRLGEPVGLQDPWVAAHGGIQCYDVSREGEVRVAPLELSEETRSRLERGLLLFFTGYSRSASRVLEDQRRRSERQDREMLGNLERIRALALEIRGTLLAGDLAGFARLMDEHWQAKRRRSPEITTPEIDRWYRIGRENGALGGKLMGAGGGGFLLFYAEGDGREGLRQAMAREGLREVEFRFESRGSTLLEASP